MFVSPALRDLLATPDGRRLLAPRLPGRVAGTIAPAGLLGPTDLAFYAGTDALRAGAGGVRRLDHFGATGARAGLDPVLTLLIVIVLVALLLPVAVLVGAAVRTGGEDRDRRLAALRLIGADQHMARRIAAGEALISAALGLALGVVVFLVLRTFAERITLWDTGVYRGRPAAEPAARPGGAGRRPGRGGARLAGRAAPRRGRAARRRPARGGDAPPAAVVAAAAPGGRAAGARARRRPGRRTRSPSCASRSA